jgi:hypothetical protein
LSTASSSLSATVLDAQAQSFVALSTHSLRLMASIAAYNPSKREPLAYSHNKFDIFYFFSVCIRIQIWLTLHH